MVRPTSDEGEDVLYDDDASEQPGGRPSSWTFKGYMPFMLLACPLATKPRVRLTIFTMDGTAEGVQSSCKVAWKKMKEEQDDDRSYGVLDGKRGVYVETQIHLESLHHRKIKAV